MKSNGMTGSLAGIVRVRHAAHILAVVVGVFVGVFVVARFVAGSPLFQPVWQTQVPANPAGTGGFLTQLSTDKPIYRPGEKVYVRGVLLRADGHIPDGSGTAYIQIKGPKGETVASGASNVTDSVVGFLWDVPASQAGGEYTVRVSHPFTGDPPAERKFDIRVYRAPRLKSQIVFVRDGYGPGDTVSANLHVDRAEGGIPAGARVSVIGRVDGADVWTGQTIVDGSGNANASFRLPSVILRGEGSIAMIVQDGGTIETATKTIPILLQTLDLAIYPEGGDLVAGMPNRVYIEGRTPAQKPADMTGVVLNSAGKEVATFRTEHDGRGRFSFTPVRGDNYSIHVIEPAGIKTAFPLPTIKPSGVVIFSTTDTIAARKDVALRVGATTAGEYGIALSQHGKEMAFKSVDLTAGKVADIAFTVPRSLDGVIVATVYDDHKIPLAERLVFREPEQALKIEVTADRADYVPGDKVSLRVKTVNETGAAVSALVGLTVTDSSVLELIDKREQSPRLPVMVLFENDVRNLADAHVYLDKANPKAAIATDLLLGTQGWRRFATLDNSASISKLGDAGRRIMGARTITDTDRAEAARANAINVIAQAAAFPRGGGRGGGGIGVGQQGQGQGAGVGPGVGMVIGGCIGCVAGGVAVQNAAVINAPPPPGGPPPIAGLPAPATPPPPPPPLLKEAMAPREVPREIARNADFIVDGLAAGALRAQAPPPPVRNDFVVVREYAHPLRPNWTEGSRADFSETVYWNAGVRTNSAGVATVSFNLSDSVTSFRVLADGVAQDGSLGSATSEVESVEPLFIEPKLPLQVTGGDVIQLPIGIVNGTSRELRGLQLLAKATGGLEFTAMENASDTLQAKERARRLMQITVSRDFSGAANLTLDGAAGPYRDTVRRNLDVQPLGFPYESSAGGVLDGNGSKTFEFTLPTGMVHGSLSSSVMVYPTPLASMTQALQSLLQQPYGCFEQTSSTSYPMVMAQQYFVTHSGIDPAIIEKTRDLLDASYKRLTGFESRSRGYEWFGADPGHEALTAYGLLQFTDMSSVRNVDKEMLDRTRTWLLSRRDGNGGFSLSAKAVDSFGRAPADTTNAYIVWALTESGEKGLSKEIAAVKASASSTSDTYIIALGANILAATGDSAGARQLMDKLARAQDAAGSVKGSITSITRSGGDALAIESTALSVLAWLREPEYAANVEKGIRWMVELNKNGRFGSTQSTVLALRSIVAYDAAHAHPKAPGRVVLTVDGKPAGSPVAFTANSQGAIVLPQFADLGPGKHSVVLRMEDGSSMPFSMNVKYYSVLPESAEQARIGIQVALKDRQVQEGGLTEAIVSITNKDSEVIPTPVAIVGIPGGLEVRHDQLKELVKSGKIDAYEVIGREIVLYWRFIKAKDKFDIPLSLVAAIPGSYTGPASRAYLYYTDEHKTWASGLTVKITPR